MNSSVIIVAAGKGKRFREKIPKQYVNLGCESIINLTIKKFINIKKYINLGVKKFSSEVIAEEYKKLYISII